jgi:hypothetical protein
MREVMTKIVIKRTLKGYLMVNNSFTQYVGISGKKICDLYCSSVKWLFTENILEHLMKEEGSEILKNSELLSRNHKAHAPTVHISSPWNLKPTFYYFIYFIPFKNLFFKILVLFFF